MTIWKDGFIPTITITVKKHKWAKLLSVPTPSLDGLDLHCRSLAAAGQALGSLDAGRSILCVSLYDMYYND
jgi:hypothetical protein